MNPPWKNWLSHWSDRTIISSFMSSGQDFGKHSSKRGILTESEYYMNGCEGQHFLQGKYCPGQGTTGCPVATFHNSAFIFSRFTWDKWSVSRPSSIMLKNTQASACSCGVVTKLAFVPWDPYLRNSAKLLSFYYSAKACKAYMNSNLVLPHFHKASFHCTTYNTAFSKSKSISSMQEIHTDTEGYNGTCLLLEHCNCR